MKKDQRYVGTPMETVIEVIISFVIMIWLACTVSSCVGENTNKAKPVSGNGLYDIYKEKVDGHEYIIFRTSGGSGIHALHSESCPCKNEK